METLSTKSFVSATIGAEYVVYGCDQDIVILMRLDRGREEGEWDGMRKSTFDMMCKPRSASIWRAAMMPPGHGINLFTPSVAKSREAEFIDSSFKYRNI